LQRTTRIDLTQCPVCVDAGQQGQPEEQQGLFDLDGEQGVPTRERPHKKRSQCSGGTEQPTANAVHHPS